MKNKFLLITERIMLTLWVGSLWAVGLMVAPTLFTQLDDRALAGTRVQVMILMLAGDDTYPVTAHIRCGARADATRPKLFPQRQT